MKKHLIRTADGAEAEIYQYGAHPVRWKTATGLEWLFLSNKARYEYGRSIRGGVPVIFPQFSGFGDSIRHGFARCVEWQCERIDSDSSMAHAEFSLTSNDDTMPIWPHRFRVDFSLALGAQELCMTLSISNLDCTPFTFCAALHTYLAITSLNDAQVHGLKGLSYWNNDGSEFQCRKTQTEDSLRFSGAIDRVYFGCTEALTLQDPKGRLQITSSGFTEGVIWNPGAEEAAKLEDLENDAWRRMLCIESVKLDKPVTLPPGETWKGQQLLRSLDP